MNSKLLAVFFLALVGTEAHRQRHRHRYGKPRMPQAPLEGHYSWTRDLGNGYSCQENALAPPDEQIIFVQVMDPVLPALGIQPANTLYDFSTAQPIEAIIPVDGPCFITQPPLTLDQNLATLNTINSTTISTTNMLPVDGTAIPLSPEEAQQLLGQSSALNATCGTNQLVPLTPISGATPIPYTGPTQIINTFTLDGAVSILAPVPPPPPQRYDDRHRHYDDGHRHRHRHHRYH